MNEIKNKLIIILNNIDVIVDEEEVDINLIEYGIDSISFISFIIEVEKEFGISLPDEVLLIESVSSLNGFSNYISQCLSSRDIS